MEIREILHRIRAGESDRAIHRALKVDRATVKRYRAWAEQEGLLGGDLPSVDIVEARLRASFGEKAPPQNVSSVEPYRALVEELRSKGVNIKTVWRRLRDRGYEGSMHAVYRFVWQMEGKGRPDLTVRVECAPGEEAQVDFGYVGLLLNEQGQGRKAWAFVMTLSWSRHMYVEFVFDQRLETWLRLHVNAFAFFGGVPRRLVCDNLKAAIVRASWDGDIPQVQWAYRELAEHYGFLIGPCRPATPQHKGKVERGVGYVKGSFVAGRDPMCLSAANQAVRTWCLGEAGLRQHGTTRQQPLTCFQQTEQAMLRPLPERAYDLATWKAVRLHRDGYVVFEGAYYSAPFRYVGQQLWVRGGYREVKLYTQDYQLVATHTRVSPGQRQTQPDHLVPYKQPGVLWNAEVVQDKARAIGPATFQTVQRLFETPVVDPLPTIRRLVKLADQYGAARLEAACARALAHDDPAYRTVKRILQYSLDVQPLQLPAPAILPLLAATTFARSVDELLGELAQVQL
jgi:transposase